MIAYLHSELVTAGNYFTDKQKWLINQFSGCCFCADNVCCKGRALENPRKARKAREQRELVQAVADGMVAAAETSRNQTFQDADAFQTSARRSRYRPNSNAYTNVRLKISILSKVNKFYAFEFNYRWAFYKT